MVWKKGPGAIAERDLIAEAAWPEDGLLNAGIKMDTGTEVASNAAISSGVKINISAWVLNPV